MSLALTAALFLAADPSWSTTVEQLLRAHPAESQRAIVSHLKSQGAELERHLGNPGLTEVLARQVAHRLSADHLGADLSERAASLPAQKRLIDVEAFRLSTYITAGVVPERYGELVDSTGPTASLETRLLVAANKVVETINAYREGHGQPTRISELEVLTTYFAAGGAQLLTTRTDLVDAVHPSGHLGVHAFALLLRRFRPMVTIVDQQAHTDLLGLVAWLPKDQTALPEPSFVPNNERWLRHDNGDRGPHAYLKRYLTFEESIAAVSLAYLDAKERATQASPDAKSFARRFIAASFMLVAERQPEKSRWVELENSTSAAYLHQLARRAGKHQRLNVWPPAEAIRQLIAGLDYPDQPSYRLPTYQVMSRYGSMIALQRFGDRFDAAGRCRACAAIPSNRPTRTVLAAPGCPLAQTG